MGMLLTDEAATDSMPSSRSDPLQSAKGKIKFNPASAVQTDVLDGRFNSSFSKNSDLIGDGHSSTGADSQDLSSVSEDNSYTPSEYNDLKEQHLESDVDNENIEINFRQGPLIRPTFHSMSAATSGKHDYHYHCHNNHQQQHNRNRRKTAWNRALTSSYKSKCETFRRLFSDTEAADEWLMVDYACAYLKRSTGLLMQGRLYITENWICFYSKILSFKTRLLLPVKKIESITKERTAKVIPNAIGISMSNKEKHFFTSFTARDRTFSILEKVWLNRQKELVFSPEEFWEQVHEYYGEDLGMSCCEDGDGKLMQAERSSLCEVDFEKSNCDKRRLSVDGAQCNCSSIYSDGTDVSGGNASNPSNIIAENHSQLESSKESPNVALDRRSSPEASAPLTSLSSGHQSANEESGCNSHSHFSIEHLDALLPIPVDHLWNLLFQPDSQFFANFALSQGHKQFKATDWYPLPNIISENPEKGPMSVVEIKEEAARNGSEGPSYPNVAVETNFFNPKRFVEWRQMEYYVSFYFQNFYTHEYQRKLSSSVPGKCYSVVSKVVHLHTLVPLDFYVENMYCLTRVDDHQSRLRVTTNVNYPSNVRLVKTLMGAAQKEVKKHFQNLHSSLQSYCQELLKTNELSAPMTERVSLSRADSRMSGGRSRYRRVTSPAIDSVMIGSGGHRSVRRRRRSDPSKKVIALQKTSQEVEVDDHINDNAHLVIKYPVVNLLRYLCIQMTSHATLCLIFITLLLLLLYGYLHNVVNDSEELNNRFTTLLEQLEKQRNQAPIQETIQQSVHDLSALTLKTTDSWTKLLLQRDKMNSTEIKRWKFVLEHTTRVVSKLLTTLKEMQNTVDTWITEEH